MKILLAGETWTSLTQHAKGVDTFVSVAQGNGHAAFVRALSTVGEVTHLPGERVPLEFPQRMSELAQFDAVVLSDIGADSLLLHPDTFERGRRTPNRLRLLQEYVRAGHGFLMCGGYLSFQGWHGRARYHGTPVEELLPVRLEAGDDREEIPEGVRARVVAEHPVTAGLPTHWPYLLGLNRLQPKEGATVLATAGAHPLLVAGTYGRGRTLAWASDIGPHWCPQGFVAFTGYARLWQQALVWLAELR